MIKRKKYKKIHKNLYHELLLNASNFQSNPVLLMLIRLLTTNFVFYL